MTAILRFRRLPSEFERAYLLWAEREIPPMHPDVGYVQRRLRELEDRRG